MKTTPILAGLLFLLSSIGALAQNRSVSGTVRDQNGQPVVGLTVIEQGTGNGVITDADGNYQISLTGRDAVLEFNALGYSTVTERVGNRSRINVTTSEEALQLEEAIAIGYGTVRKRDLTTAVSTVSTEDVRVRPVTEASGLIQGKVAGVQVIQTSGLPGSGMTIRIRGASSVSSSNDPLYVVDGVPVGEGHSAIAYLSPSDIESMQVLKDASSAAIYGSRAANGVVLITTKTGHKDRGPEVSFSSYVGLSTVKRSYEVLNAAEYKDLMDEIGLISLPDGLKDETDWFDYTYRTGVSQNYQFSVSNASDKTRWYLGGGYTDEEGVIKVAYNRRYNAKMSIESDIYKWLTVGSSVTYANYRNNGIISGTGSNRAGVVLSVINTPTYAKVWDEENPEWYWTQFYGANLTTPAENMARSENNFSQDDRAIMTAYAQLNFTPNLNFRSTVSMDRRWTHSYSFLDPIKTSYGRTQHGEATDSRYDDQRMVYDNILTWNRNAGKHNFELMAGTSATVSHWESLSGSRNYFSTEYNNVLYGLSGGNNGGLRGQSQGLSEWTIMSYLGRVAYNYDSRYYLTVNLRADGSSKLAPGHKWGYFPSFSAAWRLTGEEFMRNLTWLNDLKIRAGWGQSGNQSGLADYAWVQNYATNYFDWTNSAYAQATPTLGGKTNIGNKDLTWETTTQTNVGVDAAMLKGRINLTFDAYYKYTTNLLMSVPLPSPYPSIYRNEGEMSNWGLEFSLNSTNIDTRDFSWTTDFNISMNRNRLEKLTLQQVYYTATTSELQNENIIRATPGQSLSQFWGYTAEGVDPETGLVIYKDLNEDGKIDANDKSYIGNANPKFIWGMTNNLSWKELSLSFLITSSVGNDIYNASLVDMIAMCSDANQIKAATRRWRTPGQITDIPKAGELYNIKASTRFVEDGSYIKVRNITLSYDVKAPFLQKAHIALLQPYVTLDNMITLTKYSGYDPEMSQYTNAAAMGIDWGTYPNVRTVTLGVNVNF